MVIVFLKWTLSCGWKDWPKDLFVNSKQWIPKRGKPQILPTFFLMKWALKRGTLFVSSTGPWPQTKFIVTFDTCFWYSFSGSFTWWPAFCSPSTAYSKDFYWLFKNIKRPENG